MMQGTPRVRALGSLYCLTGRQRTMRAVDVDCGFDSVGGGDTNCTMPSERERFGAGGWRWPPPLA